MDTKHSQRVRRVLMSTHVALEMFRRLRQEHTTNLPGDAWPVRVCFDAERDAFSFIVESQTFEPVTEGEPIPLLEVSVQT
jgi:Flp pilus assembly protein CpaB